MIKKLFALILVLVIGADSMASSKRKAEDDEIETKLSKFRASPMEAEEKEDVEVSINLSASYPRKYKVINLDLSLNKHLYNVNFLLEFPYLTDLKLNSCENLGDNYRTISRLSNLKRLDIYDIGLTTTEYLKPLVKLEYLRLWCPDLGKCIEPLAHLDLKELVISGRSWKGLTELSKLISLESLVLRDFWQQDDESEEFPTLDFLTPLVNLRKLDLSDNIYINSINPISVLPNLTYLNLTGCPLIVDLYCLDKSISLQELDLSKIWYGAISMTKENLVALTQINSLRKLTIHKSIDLPDSFPPLVEIIKN